VLAWPFADAKTQGAAARVVVRDPWGNVDCATQGACAG
jgi:hypothetical protein